MAKKLGTDRYVLQLHEGMSLEDGSYWKLEPDDRKKMCEFLGTCIKYLASDMAAEAKQMLEMIVKHESDVKTLRPRDRVRLICDKIENAQTFNSGLTGTVVYGELGDEYVRVLLDQPEKPETIIHFHRLHLERIGPHKEGEAIYELSPYEERRILEWSNKLFSQGKREMMYDTLLVAKDYYLLEPLLFLNLSQDLTKADGIIQAVLEYCWQRNAPFGHLVSDAYRFVTNRFMKMQQEEIRTGTKGVPFKPSFFIDT